MSAALPWQVFRKDLGRKLVALCLALVVWWLLSEQVSGEDEIALDVRIVATRAQADQDSATSPGIYVVVPEHLIVREVTHKQVTVRLRGLAAELADLQVSAVLEVPADLLAQKDEDTWSPVLERRSFRSRGRALPVGEVDFDPRRLGLLLAERTSQTFDLDHRQVSVTGTPRAGRFADTQGSRVEPNQVVLTGPRSAIAALRTDPTRLRLAPVDVSSQSLDVVRQVGLDVSALDQGVTLATAGNVVTVTVPIRSRDVERELFSVKVVYKNEDDLARRSRRLVEATTELDLIVVGPLQLLDPAILPDSELRAAIQPTFDWRNASLERASDKVSVLTLLPDAVDVLGLDRREPEIQYELAPVETATEGSSPAPAPPPAGGEPP